MATIAHLNPTEQLEVALNERFIKLSDGFWYPLDRGVALVRIGVQENTYQIQRRRDPKSVWLSLMEGMVAEFDLGTFSQWASSWPLTTN